MNKQTSPINRKVLGTIQPETPSRRTTFSISNHQNTVDHLQVTDDKENTNTNSMKSCSPLSFEKTKSPPHRVSSKTNLTVPKTQNFLNISQQSELDNRRQTYSIPKKAAANRTLFGNGKPKTSVDTINVNAENINKENEKPKPFLRRKSVSQTVASM